ncbi:sugar ABC transporter ATP-binding protein [Exilibacterium tricleocarpae]|uniref:sugar ABC transporter ATP-binding protein n=1 Tax=Exilibacterium tricleocarpae TaxID=2591008 RepID=UPI001C553929|nr:sugar ABC transporter ATP-binding protein [Exilibacterium tricleocarpae]
MAAGTPLLEARALGKTFAVPVLSDLDFQLRPGEVHALMGSNGAGKSTLSNLIAGVHRPSSGQMLLEGRRHAPASVREAEAAGVRMVMQELNLFPTLSVAENLCFKSLGNRFGVIDRRQLRRRAQRALESVGLAELNPDTAVGGLGVGQQQLLEIAGVLAAPVKLLILDEPTAALTDPQIELLFTRLRQLRDDGAGIVYISHRMDEIQKIADRVSVLRDGRLVATRPVAAMDIDTMVELMAGADAVAGSAAPAGVATSAAKTQAQPVLLKVDGLGRRGAFDGVDLSIRAGEVLGLGGLIGAGRTEFLRAVFGADRADSGWLRFAGDDFTAGRRPASPAEAIACGIGMVVEDRKAEGLLLSQSLLANISIGSLSKLRSRLGFIDTEAETRLVETATAALAVKSDSLEQPVSTLSGGNQQKVLIARWLLRDLQVLLFDEPTRGVDARAKLRIHRLLRELAQRGKAVVMVSSETRELLQVADRIAVLSNGRLAGEFDARTLSEEQLLEASFKYYSGVGQSAARTKNQVRA